MSHCSPADWTDITPVTVLVAEFLTEPDIPDPVGLNLGHARMLRVSPVVPVPDAC
jgi:hypothetical protein